MLSNVLKRVNPARAIMGRLFLWFWVTFIVTALLAIWGSRVFFEELEVVDVKPRDVAELNAISQRLARPRLADASLLELLNRSSRGLRGRLAAINIATEELTIAGGPPLRANDKRDLQRLVSQSSPIAIKRGAIKLVGPVFFERNGERYALFSAKFDMPERKAPPVLLFLIIALVTTTVLSWLFARTLTNPILHIQGSVKKLAGGDWHTRVDKAANRQDELGQLARDFNTMAEQLESMWGAQKRLLADVSHELRSPLARLQMALGLAHQQNVDPETLKRVEREADRMEALIGQLLALSRAEAGEVSLQTMPLSLALNDVFTDANFEAANSNKQLLIQAIPEYTVCVDSMMLCRAVENVLRNAIRHSHYLTEVSFNADATHWFIHITDDGDGLSKEECERIFAPFYRASLARERESGGVGLGLSIAKAAVELHHGRITAAPANKGGLHVTLAFKKQ
ncbi:MULTISPECIES: ATP-binding protein [unclassified Alteromonas]|uniref:ATP-binding protein n=1 Tax=unclassified Alteromonas TaxID=2614992 RepID=UPI001921D9C9|nr:MULTISPECIES: ATP-binding protein [unclassified Alteromonas]